MITNLTSFIIAYPILLVNFFSKKLEKTLKITKKKGYSL